MSQMATQPIPAAADAAAPERSQGSQLQDVISAALEGWGPNHPSQQPAEARLLMVHSLLAGLAGCPAAKAAAQLGPLVAQWVQWSLAPSSMLFVAAQQQSLVLGGPRPASSVACCLVSGLGVLACPVGRLLGLLTLPAACPSLGLPCACMCLHSSRSRLQAALLLRLHQCQPMPEPLLLAGSVVAYLMASGTFATAKASKAAPQVHPWTKDQLEALLGQPWASGSTQPDMAELAAGDRAKHLAQRSKLYALQVGHEMAAAALLHDGSCSAARCMCGQVR